MTAHILGRPDRLLAATQRLGLVAVIAVASVLPARAQDARPYFRPSNLVVSRSVYDNNPKNVRVGMTLPPGCATTKAGCAGKATNDGTYPYVWNNNIVDGSFGITSKIYLDQYTPAGVLINSLEVPNSSQRGVTLLKDQLVTNFSSKSELALNLSSDRKYLSFMGYVTAIDKLDVSNSNTPAVVDPTNPVGTKEQAAVTKFPVPPR